MAAPQQSHPCAMELTDQRFGKFSFSADAEKLVVQGFRGGRRDFPVPFSMSRKQL